MVGEGWWLANQSDRLNGRHFSLERFEVNWPITGSVLQATTLCPYDRQVLA